LSGTWGDTVNNSITSLVDTAVAGTTNVSADSNVTLTTTTGASNQARQAILLFSGSRTAIRTVTAPAQSKIYTVINATTGGFAVQLVGAGPTTGVTIVAGESAVCAWNGSDFVKVSNTGGSGTFTNLTVTGVATFSAGSASTPALTTAGDTNTGMFFPAADTIAFAEGGVEAMRLDASGNMGIGTSSPDSKFHVVSGASSTLAQLRIGFNGTSVNYYDANTHYFRDGSGPTDRMVLNSSGNLGLGVTPSAWGTANGVKALQTPAGALWNFTSGNLYLGQNYYFNGTNRLYLNNTAACEYQQSAGIHSWWNAPSGTAGNAITFTQAMTLDASGNLGVGTTSPSYRLDVSGFNATARINSSVAGGNSTLRFLNGTGNNAAILFGDTDDDDVGFIQYVHSDNSLRVNVNAAERARIDSSGNLLLNTTSQNGAGRFSVKYNGSSEQGINIRDTANASGSAYMVFGSSTGTTYGTITNNSNSGVLYNVTSDQRLKENIVDAPEFGSVIDSIQVRSYDWKANGIHQRAGFIAQELVTVAPEAVHQPTDTDEMMAVDYSKLVPMLVKEVQSLRQRIATLEAK
jgi:hypothetical protein